MGIDPVDTPGQPKANSTKNGDYGSARQDDYSDDHDSADDKVSKNGDDSLGSEADSVKASDDASDSAPRRKKKRHSSGTAGSDGPKNPPTSSKKWWYIGAALAVLLVALIFGGLYFVSRARIGGCAASSAGMAPETVARH